MKKLFAIFLASIMLAGCGADEKEMQEEKVDLRPMVMVDGNIYLDTGKESEITARCGVMDGEITSSVDGKPTENNQSNFGTGYGYQFVNESEIEVYMNDKWIVFEMEETNSLGLELTAKDVTPSGMTLVVKQNGGNATGEIQTGEDYSLKVNKNGEWVDVETVIEDYAWNSIAYMIEKDGEREFEIDWEWLYGKLERGKYKLVKSFMDFRGTGDYDSTILGVEFEIE